MTGDEFMAEPFKIADKRPAAGPAKGRPAPEDDPRAEVCYTFSHPKFGDIAASRDADGTAWVCGRDYIGAFAGAVLGGILPPDWRCPEDLANDIFKSLPTRFKAVKRFHTPEGFQDLLAVTLEGLKYYHDLNARRDDGPGLRLVK